MLDELNDYLYEYGFDTQLDSDGIYIPEYNIDIIIEDSIYIIRPFNSDTVTAYSIEEAINYIRDFSYSLEFSKEMEKNNYSYEKKSPIYFSIGNDKVKIIDGHIYFENENGETTVYVNIASVISAIQSKFLGEK